jgi:hypothetical protein
LVVDAAEYTEPSKDHLNEHAGSLSNIFLGKGAINLKCNTPIFDIHISYGSNRHEAFLSRLMADIKLQRLFLLMKDFYARNIVYAAKYCIVQFGSYSYGSYEGLIILCKSW